MFESSFTFLNNFRPHYWQLSITGQAHDKSVSYDRPQNLKQACAQFIYLNYINKDFYYKEQLFNIYFVTCTQ